MTRMATKRAIRSERDEERLCDDLVARISSRDCVVRFSQPRNTMQTPGIPDRRYWVYNVALWYEIKAANGRLTGAQEGFLRSELARGCLAACGTLEDLAALLPVLRAVAHPVMPVKAADVTALCSAHAACRELVDRWAAKGFRPR